MKYMAKAGKNKCHPEFISGSTPIVIIQNKEEMLKQVPHDSRHGFTLIELLVGVLIIGILAAVAVPQYQKAVVKARVAEHIVNLRSLGEAAKICKLQKGEECTLDELDIEVPPCNPIPGTDTETDCSYHVLSSGVYLYYIKKGGSSGGPELLAYHYEPYHLSVGQYEITLENIVCRKAGGSSAPTCNKIGFTNCEGSAGQIVCFQ